jgi:hypothetical protein
MQLFSAMLVIVMWTCLLHFKKIVFVMFSELAVFMYCDAIKQGKRVVNK